MAQQKFNWQKIATWFIGFAIGKGVFDYFTKSEIDIYGMIFIPLIALGLIYLVNKEQLMQ